MIALTKGSSPVLIGEINMGTKKMNRLTKRILLEMVVMVSVTVLLVVLIGNTWASYESPESTEPSGSESNPPEATGALAGMENFLSANNLTEKDYPSWLLKKFNSNAENAQFLLNYPLRYGVEHEVNLSGTATDKVPLLVQWDDRWGYRDYAGEIMGTAGAAPTCMSMVAYYLTGEVIYTPAYFADYARNNGFTLEQGGTDWTFFSEGAVQMGFKVTEVPNVKGAVMQYLEAGIPVVVFVGPGAYTAEGHYMVLTGVSGESIVLNDPMSPINSQLRHNWDTLAESALKFWAIQNP